MPVLPRNRQPSGQPGQSDPNGRSMAGSGKAKRKPKPTTKAGNRKKKIKETYAKAREEAQLAGVIYTTPDGAVRDEVVPASAQTNNSELLPALIATAIRNGWAVPDDRKPGLVDEMVSIIDNPEMPAKVKVAAFTAILKADQQQFDRDNPEAAGKARGAGPGAKVAIINSNNVNAEDVFGDIKRDLELVRSGRVAGHGVPADGTAKQVDAPEANGAKGKLSTD